MSSLQQGFSKGTLQLMGILWFPAQRDESSRLGQSRRPSNREGSAVLPNQTWCHVGADAGRVGIQELNAPSWSPQQQQQFAGIGFQVTLMSGRIVVRINKYGLFAKQTQLGKGKVRTAGNILSSFILTTALLFQLLMCILCNVLASMFQSPLPKR